MSEEDRKKALWDNYKPKVVKEESGMSRPSGIQCQHCDSNNAENSPLRGNMLCSSCKNAVWKSDTAGSNYDRFIGMGSTHEEAISDSGYEF